MVYGIYRSIIPFTIQYYCTKYGVCIKLNFELTLSAQNIYVAQMKYCILFHIPYTPRNSENKHDERAHDFRSHSHTQTHTHTRENVER